MARDAKTTGKSAGASDIKEWMRDGWDPPVYYDAGPWAAHQVGDFIHAKPGTNSSAVCQVPDEVDIFPLPVYDAVPYCPTDITSPRPDCPTQGSAFVYHIVGIAYVRIVKCNQGKGELELELVEEILGSEAVGFREGTGYGEAGACATRIQAVTLWE